MPQVDIVTYTSQLFWVIIIFFSFYIVVLRYVLPTISKTLKYRKKRLISYNNQIIGLSTEQKLTISDYEILLSSVFHLSKTIILRVTDITLAWLNTKIQETNQKTFLDINLKYLISVSTIVSQGYLVKRCIF